VQYRVSCTGRGGTTNRSVSVTVGQEPIPPETVGSTTVSLPYKTTHIARIMVWRDSNTNGTYDAGIDVASEWYALPSAFSTDFAPPAPSAVVDPEKPREDQDVLFEDAGTCPSGSCTRTWDYSVVDVPGTTGMGGGTPLTYSFADSLQGVTVMLTSTDDGTGAACTSALGPFDISKAIPKFKEVAPQ